MTFDSSILTHVFRYDLFIHWMSFIFSLRFTLIQFAQNIFIIRVDRLRTGAWELFFGNTVYGDWKKVSALALSLAVH